MKKLFFLSILAVGALASCSKSEVVDASFDNAIKFENYLGRDAQTKAAVIEKEDLEHVLVNAWLHPAEETPTVDNFEANFMNAVEVNMEGKYSPIKYWPNELQKVSFVAWVPVTNATVAGAELTFAVPADDVKKQTDLIVAGSQLNRNNDGTVNLNFQHLLSRIGFEITGSNIPEDTTKEGENGTTETVPAENVVKLTSVVLNGDFAANGTVDMTAATPVIKAPKESDAYVLGTKSYTLTGNNFGLVENRILNDTYTTASTDSYIMLIPDGNAPKSITVTYQIVTAGSTTPITNTATFELTEAYEAGMAYKYIFTIKLNAIDFKVEVAKWEDAEDVTINPTPNA